jgi:hypothetical protein
MHELVRMGQNLKSTVSAEMRALMEYYAVYGGNAAYSSSLRITAICCVISQKSAHLIYHAAEA